MKTNLDSVLEELITSGFDPGLTRESYESITGCGLRSKNLQLAWAAASLLIEEKPCTLRGLFNRIVSAGLLPSTDKVHYKSVGRLMTTLREARIIPFDWLIGNIRSTFKPSSWSGLGDFADTVREAYRMDYWDQLPEYVHIIVGKDAIAGVLQLVTHEYDVALSPIPGFVSLSFAAEIASKWNRIDKPITAYYLGDYDASGFDLERCPGDIVRGMDSVSNWSPRYNVAPTITMFCVRQSDGERELFPAKWRLIPSWAKPTTDL